MRNLLKTLSLATMAAAGILVIGLMTSQAAQSPQDCGSAVSDCGCQTAGCRGGCQLGSRLRDRKQCPKCECDTCALQLDLSEVKKSCFKTEQKLICVPTVRMPWQKCCPPASSKTRSVTVLKKHSYSCPNCAYKWTVQAPGNVQSQNAYSADAYSPNMGLPMAPTSPTLAAPGFEAPMSVPVDPTIAAPPLPFDSTQPQVEGILSTPR